MFSYCTLIMKPIESQQVSESFIIDIRAIIERGRKQAYAAAGAAMFATNWEIGRRIVEEEQNGNARAQYGKQVISMLANNLKDDYGACYGQRNLAYYRQFYLSFSDLSMRKEGSQHPSLKFGWASYTNIGPCHVRPLSHERITRIPKRRSSE